MLKPTPDFFDALATDCELSADRAQSVINAIQRNCLETGEPTYFYVQDMQELTSAVLKMQRMASLYRKQSQAGFINEAMKSDEFASSLARGLKEFKEGNATLVEDTVRQLRAGKGVSISPEKLRKDA